MTVRGHDFVDWQKIEFEFLDTLDLKTYLKSHVDLYDVRNQIENDFGDKYGAEDCIFNDITMDEFCNYLEARYPDVYVEEQTYTYYIVHLKD